MRTTVVRLAALMFCALQAATSASVAATMARSGRGIAIAHVTAKAALGQGAGARGALAR